jgi:hydroxymethylpyrimidine/phosphomethylpyrimidine kinase
MGNLPRILIIAGSDSGGGAGIQGDLKTVSFLGGYGTTAITALTAQNTRGVDAIHAVTPIFVRQQMDAVLSDIGADAIKTGMLLNAPIIETVASALGKYREIPLVVDPVMVAKGGAALLEPEAITALQTKLMPLAFLVTPNLPEAEMLASTLISNVDGMVSAGKRIIKNTGCQAVLVKGGHGVGDVITDMLVTETSTQAFTSSRIASKNTHGTGCTLASAIATYLGMGEPLPFAVEKARHYVAKAIMAAPAIGHGHGPLGHGWVLNKS